MQIDDGQRAARTHLRDRIGRAGGEHVATQHQVGFAGGDALGAQALRGGGDLHVRGDRTVLLAHAGHVQHRGAFCFQVGGHAHQRADGDHASAADAVDQDVVRVLDRWEHRLGQQTPAIVIAFARAGLALLQRAAFDGDEARAEALGAGIIFVAGRLVDLALAPEFGFLRQDRHAVRLDAAVAAAFADGFVDDHALRQIGELAFLAAAALLGGAGLVVDDDRHARQVAQFALDVVHLLAVVQGHDARQARSVGIARQVFGHQGDALHAFGCHLLGDHRHRGLAVDRLAAGHGHRVVVQDFIGDVHLGRDGGTHGEIARVEIGAVAQVLEHVRHFRERCLADPGRAFAAHVGGQLVHLGVDRGGHHVAADAGQREGTVGHLGRGVVRAAGAVERRAERRGDRLLQHRVFRIEEGQACADQVARGVVGDQARDAAGDHARHLRHREVGFRRQQPVAARRHPLALVVELADDVRTDVVAPVVQLFLQLVFDDLALLFDHQDFFQSLREFAHAFRFQRPDHRDLEQAQADFRGHDFVDAEFFQRFQHVQVGFTRGDDAELGVRAVDGGVIQLVFAGVGQGCIDLVVLHQRFLVARLLAQRDRRQLGIQAAFGHHEVLRQFHLHAVRVGIDRGARFDRVGQGLEGDRTAREARHRPAVHAQVQVFLHVAGVEHRDHAGREDVIRLVRQGRGIGAVVVAGHQQHAAVFRCAGMVHVLEDVAAAVHARALAVPHGEHAVVLARADQVDGLRAPDGGRGQVFVHARDELHVVRFQVRLRLPQRFVEAAQGRTAVAGDKAGRVEAGGGVALALHHRQAHQGLDTGQEDVTGLGGVFVV